MSYALTSLAQWPLDFFDTGLSSVEALLSAPTELLQFHPEKRAWETDSVNPMDLHRDETAATAVDVPPSALFVINTRGFAAPRSGGAPLRRRLYAPKCCRGKMEFEGHEMKLFGGRMPCLVGGQSLQGGWRVGGFGLSSVKARVAGRQAVK